MATSATINYLIMRRALMALVAVAASLLMVLGTAALPAKAQSAPSGTSITVNTTADEINTDGDCSLREAIVAANTNQATDACPAGSATGEDAIGFDPTTGSLSLNGQLPKISDAAGLVIKGPKQITASSDGFRALWVNADAELALGDLSFSGFNIYSGEQAARGRGGVIYTDGGTLEVANSTFTDNRAGAAGGAIYSGYDGTLEVANSTFLRNTTIDAVPFNEISPDSYGGGAILVYTYTPGSEYGTAKVTNSTFSGNSAYGTYGEGGAIKNVGSLLEVTGSTFTRNKAEDRGGGIFHGYGSVPYAELHVTNSTFAWNWVTDIGDGTNGGGIATGLNGVANVTYSTFVGNGIDSDTFAKGLNLRGTILANGGPDCPSSSIAQDNGYNISNDDSCHFSEANNSLPNTNPLLDLSGLQDNGGPTKTVALQSTSPAIDAIERDVNGCENEFESRNLGVIGYFGPLRDITQDQRGVMRPQGQGCDIGAFEAIGAATTITSPEEGSVTTIPFTISGTAEPNSSVELFDWGNSLNQTAAVNAEGNWFFELSNVSEGPHSYTVNAKDAAGTTSSVSERRRVIVDKTAPGAPVITSPAQGARLNYRSFSVAGTAEAGARVELFEGALLRGTATADTYGKWKIPLSGVSEGSHSYTAKATDQAGNTSAPSSTRMVIVDTTKPRVTSVVPAENATAVVPYENVYATVSEAMKASTINTTTFKLFKKGSTTAITATVSYDPIAKKATLNPSAELEPEVTYKAVVTTGAKDLAGNALDQNPTLTGNQQKVWYFKVIFDPTEL
jgi:CSLREA domain-containing protein